MRPSRGELPDMGHLRGGSGAAGFGDGGVGGVTKRPAETSQLGSLDHHLRHCQQLRRGGDQAGIRTKTLITYRTAIRPAERHFADQPVTRQDPPCSPIDLCRPRPRRMSDGRGRGVRRHCADTGIRVIAIVRHCDLHRGVGAGSLEAGQPYLFLGVSCFRGWGKGHPVGGQTVMLAHLLAGDRFDPRDTISTARASFCVIFIPIRDTYCWFGACKKQKDSCVRRVRLALRRDIRFRRLNRLPPAHSDTSAMMPKKIVSAVSL